MENKKGFAANSNLDDLNSIVEIKQHLKLLTESIHSSLLFCKQLEKTFHLSINTLISQLEFQTGFKRELFFDAAFDNSYLFTLNDESCKNEDLIDLNLITPSFVEKDDFVKMLIECEVDGKSINNKEKQSYFRIGKYAVNEKVELAALGHKIGDIFEVDIAYANDIPFSDVAGKNIKYKISILDIKRIKKA